MLSLLALLLLPAQPPSPLDGNWVSACLPMGKGGRHGTIVTLTIDGRHVTAIAQTYAHASCDTPTIETRLVATSDKADVQDGTATARLTVVDVTMTPQAADVAAIWNQDRTAKDCGEADWQPGVAQSVAGKTCMPGIHFPTRQAQLSGRAAFSGDTLRLPSPLGGSDAGGDQAMITLTRAKSQ